MVFKQVLVFVCLFFHLFLFSFEVNYEIFMINMQQFIMDSNFIISYVLITLSKNVQLQLSGVKHAMPL